MIISVMGLAKNMSIIGLVAALSFYGTDAAVTAVTGPAAGTAAAGEVTTGVVSGLTVKAAVMVAENTPTGNTIATITSTVDGIAKYEATSTVFEVHPNSGAVSFTGKKVAATISSPYTLVVVISDADAAGSASGEITFTITVNAIPVFVRGTNCLIIGDAIAACPYTSVCVSATIVKSYLATAEHDETITYSIDGTSNTDTDFAISSAGVLSTLNVMDKRTTGEYTLIIEATDDAAWPTVGTLVVHVAVDGTSAPKSCATAGLLGSLIAG